MRIKNPNTDRDKVYIGAKVPRSLKKALQRRAMLEHRTMANIIDLALRQYTATEP
jgi:hypothetical protein